MLTLAPNASSRESTSACVGSYCLSVRSAFIALVAPCVLATSLSHPSRAHAQDAEVIAESPEVAPPVEAQSPPTLPAVEPPAVAEPAAVATPAARDPALVFLDGFHFGSYGRIIAATDLRGSTGRQARLVTFAPRADEDDTYAEVELRREDHMFGVDTRMVITLAYAGPLFQYDGDFSERIAVRNLFAEASNILTRGLSIWGGSRMVRGDDVYLMNFWPMDNLNMVGGGLRYALEDDLEFAVQVGMSQPNNPFQRQTELLPARVGFTPDEVFILDRPRIVLSGRATYWPFGRNEANGLKAVLYGEQHWLSAGTRLRADGTREGLPEDSGYVLGAQLGGYISGDHAFVNLFFRYARGLGAYDPLGVPFGTGTVITTGRAEEIRLALSGNWEWRANPDIAFGVMLGAWWRVFHDADPALFSRAAVSEGAIAIRPQVWFGDVAGVAVDLSYQGLQQLAINELTGNPDGGSVYKLALMPFVSPLGRGSYTRPQIRLVYSVTGRDLGARNLLNPGDPRVSQDFEHFLGVNVEWWFSSTSYAP